MESFLGSTMAIIMKSFLDMVSTTMKNLGTIQKMTLVFPILKKELLMSGFPIQKTMLIEIFRS